VLDTPISEVSQIPGVIGPVTLPGSGGGPIVIPSPYEPIPAGGFAPGPVGLDALAAIEAALDPQSLQAAIDQLAYRDVNVYLPKFRLDTSAMLGTTLGDMGMPTAFTGAADFSGIADADLQISGVVHKAFIEVDEEGTEAAAATGVIIGVTSAYHPGMPLLFNADHPFEFLIRDNLTGSTLFMGRVARPDGEIAAVPEPAGMVLAVAGCMWLVVMRVRRRKETARC
jgi:serpin B